MTNAVDENSITSFYNEQIKSWRMPTNAHNKLDKLTTGPGACDDVFETRMQRARTHYGRSISQSVRIAAKPLALVDFVIGEGERTDSHTNSVAHNNGSYAQGVLQPLLDGITQGLGAAGYAVGHASFAVLGAVVGLAAPLVGSTPHDTIARLSLTGGQWGQNVIRGVVAVARDVIVAGARLASAALKGAYIAATGVLSSVVCLLVFPWYAVRGLDSSTRAEAVIRRTQAELQSAESSMATKKQLRDEKKLHLDKLSENYPEKVDELEEGKYDLLSLESSFQAAQDHAQKMRSQLDAARQKLAESEKLKADGHEKARESKNLMAGSEEKFSQAVNL